MEPSVNAKPGYPVAGLRFLLLWVGANTAAWILGLGVPLFAGIALFNSLSIEATTGESTSLLGFVVACVAGVMAFPTALSVGQWLVLRRHIAGAVWWIPASFVGMIGGIIFALSLQSSLIGRVGLGAVVALPQWLVLRRQLSGAIWWIPANIVTAFFWLRPVFSSTGLDAVDLFVPGVIGSLVTGGVLLWLLRHRKPTQ